MIAAAGERKNYRGSKGCDCSPGFLAFGRHIHGPENSKVKWRMPALLALQGTVMLFFMAWAVYNATSCGSAVTVI